MKYIVSILFLGLGIAGLISGLLYQQYINEIFLGMIAPLIVLGFLIIAIGVFPNVVMDLIDTAVLSLIP